MHKWLERALAVEVFVCITLGIFFVMCSDNADFCQHNLELAWLYSDLALLMIVCAAISMALLVHEENRRDRYERYERWLDYLEYRHRLDTQDEENGDYYYE